MILFHISAIVLIFAIYLFIRIVFKDNLGIKKPKPDPENIKFHSGLG